MNLLLMSSEMRTCKKFLSGGSICLLDRALSRSHTHALCVVASMSSDGIHLIRGFVT